MKTNHYTYKMKLTGYELRTAIGILNEQRLAMKARGCTLKNSAEYADVFNLLSKLLEMLPA